MHGNFKDIKFYKEETDYIAETIQARMDQSGLTVYALNTYFLMGKETINRILKKGKNFETKNYHIKKLLKTLDILGLSIDIVKSGGERTCDFKSFKASSMRQDRGYLKLYREDTLRIAETIKAKLIKEGISLQSLRKFHGFSPKQIRGVLKNTTKEEVKDYTIFSLLKIARIAGLRVRIIEKEELIMRLEKEKSYKLISNEKDAEIS